MQCSVVGFGVSVDSVCLWAVLIFAVLRESIFTAASKWPSQRNCRAARPAPCLSLRSLRVLLFPCPACAAGRNLLGRCLYGSFCIAMTYVGFPQPPSSPSVSQGCVHLTLSSGSPPSVSQTCVHLSQLPRLTLHVAGLVCTCFSSP